MVAEGMNVGEGVSGHVKGEEHGVWRCQEGESTAAYAVSGGGGGVKGVREDLNGEVGDGYGVSEEVESVELKSVKGGFEVGEREAHRHGS